MILIANIFCYSLKNAKPYLFKNKKGRQTSKASRKTKFAEEDLAIEEEHHSDNYTESIESDSDDDNEESTEIDAAEMTTRFVIISRPCIRH